MEQPSGDRLWNASHCLGGGLILVLCASLVGRFHWRACFFVPAAIALAVAVLLAFLTPDTPGSVGLPEVEGPGADPPQDAAAFRAFVLARVFRNPTIWLVSAANFFVYAVRLAVLDWGPTMLMQAKHIHIRHAAWMVVAFEGCGLVGAVVGGRITDRFLGGRALRACVVYMALAGLSLLAFWKLPVRSELLSTGLLGLAGFFIYGPQCLLAVAAANLATRRAAASAIGLTSLFGYAATVVSGWGLGALVQRHGWDAGFLLLLGATGAGTLLFALAWPARAHGYAE